jgi:Fe-S-cluster containining protein
MTSTHDQEEFLRLQQGLAPGEAFSFGCHPGVPCFNDCCADLELVLRPYDLLRLRGALDLSSREFIQRYAWVGIQEGTGFPIVFLSMLQDERKSCPFVGEHGCRLYAERPGACRMYPLGRGTSLEERDRVAERYVLIREDHCRGFREPSTWTLESWLRDQGLDAHIQFDDRYLRLHQRWKRLGRRMDQNQVGMVMLALYHLDDFAKRIRERGWLNATPLPRDQKTRILTDDTARLNFAFVWLEKALLGSCSQIP